MLAVSAAYKSRSLSAFEAALQQYKSELSDDPIIKNHLSNLYDTMLQNNLLKVIEPYSRVELKWVAELVGQPVSEVEAKFVALRNAARKDSSHVR